MYNSAFYKPATTIKDIPSPGKRVEVTPKPCQCQCSKRCGFGRGNLNIGYLGRRGR